MKTDNAGFVRKRQLRVNLLKLVKEPLVLETHAGYGRLFRHCYAHVPFGIAIDKNADKVQRCARARPTWAVYEADSEKAIAEGLGSIWSINFLDVDPWGDPWPTLAAFFEGKRERAPEIVVAVTDGLRTGLTLGISWKVASLRAAVEKRGNAEMYRAYLEVCEEMLTALAAAAGYRVATWSGYYTGHAQQMTHYGALLVRA